MSHALIARMYGVREWWFPLDGAKRLKLRRPPELDLPGLKGGITLDRMKEIVVGWEGFTEADLLGPTVGSDSVVAFDVEVMALYLADHSDDFSKAATEILQKVMEYLKQKADTAKN
jgi:hypothetical protein